jgi:RNA polymerase sigma-70 factor, ECF subfamily
MTDVIVSARRDMETLYGEHGDRLWWALVAFSGDREIASEAASDAFAQAFRRGMAITDPLAWVWRAAFRIAAGELEERARQAPSISEPLYELPEPAAEVSAALGQLSAQQRAAVVLHHYADRPIREIAEILGASSATVAVQLHRGRSRLRDLLGTTMHELRERLRRIEAAPPPDLWAAIEAREREERPVLEPEVIAFRRPGADVRRRLAAGLVAAAVFAVTVVLVWGAVRTAPIPRPRLDQLPHGWERCTNAVLGYSIGYLANWHTTDILNGEQDRAYACRWFSPDAFGPDGNLVSEGWGYPMEVAIRGPFDQVRAQEIDPELASILVEEELVVDGHRAVRLEYETLVDLTAETGLHYEYLVELDPETTLIVHTTTTRGVAGVYAENKVIVDRAVDTLRFSSSSASA